MNKHGPHFQSNRVNNWPQAMNQMADGAWVKILDDVNMSMDVKLNNPALNVVVRFWRDNMQQFSTDREWSRNHARTFINTWLNESFLHMAQYIDAVEDFNEYYAVSQNSQEILARVIWAQELVRVWQDEYLVRHPQLSHIKWCLANTAVGNDIPWEVAELAHRNNYYIGYHGYTSVVTKDYRENVKYGAPARDNYVRPNFRDETNPMYWANTTPAWHPLHKVNRPELQVAIVPGERSPNEWIWGSGRVLEQDIHDYQPRGIYPEYIFTECGLVRDLNGRAWLQPNDGWKHSQVTGGNKDRYIELEEEVAVLDAGWNRANNGRLKGRIYFTSGANDWPYFDINGNELNYLMAQMSNFPETPPTDPPPTPPTPPPPTPPPTPPAELQNGSFEEGWYHPNNIPELQIPEKWDFRYWGSSEPNPHDPAPHARFVRPEVRVLPKDHLPEHEQDLYVLDGEYTLKPFKKSGSWYAQFSQRLALPPGTYRLITRVFADLVQYYEDGEKVWANDPQGRDGLMKLEANGQDLGGWTSLIPGEWNQDELVFNVQEGEQTAILVTFMCPFPLRGNNGLFCDKWELTEEATMPEQYIKGIDISHWNGELDGMVCEGAGNEYVIVKATDGFTIVPDAAEPRLDPHYATNTQQAINHNLLVGSYHYFQPAKPAAEQAEVFLDAITLAEEQHLPPVLDFEEHPLRLQTKQMLRAMIMEWLTIVEDQTGQVPMIYTNQNYYNLYLDVPSFDRFPLLIASWRNGTQPSLPNRRGGWEFWQWNATGGGHENGVQSFSVDKDRWEGTLTEFDAKYASDWTQDQPTPPTPPTPTNPCENMPPFASIFNVLPPGRSQEIYDAILKLTLWKGQSTGFSYDHAGASCNPDNTAVLWDISDLNRPIFVEWFADRYPLTTVQFEDIPPIKAKTLQDTLADKLLPQKKGGD